jgi:hypothetical protein
LRVRDITDSTIAATIGQASGQESIFIASQQQVAFGISIPADSSSNDIYFTLAAASSLKWAAVGLGSSEMKGALFLIIYSSASGANVTLSTRTVSGNVEPIYDSGLHVEALAGTGTANGTMTFSGRCANCRSWSGGGSIDVSSEAQDCIFALAPDGPMNSDDYEASLNYHTIYGSFSMNLKQAASSVASPPLLGMTGTESSSGSTLLSDKSTQNWITIIHAAIMVGCFIGLLPFGVIFLRVMDKVRWHAFNQSLALVGIIIGAGFGIYDSMRYNRVGLAESCNDLECLLDIDIFVEQKLQHCPSGRGAAGGHSHGRPVSPGFHPSSHLQTDTPHHQACTYTCMAWPHSHHCWRCRCFPVSASHSCCSVLPPYV